jgi:hypothetical protein
MVVQRQNDVVDLAQHFPGESSVRQLVDARVGVDRRQALGRRALAGTRVTHELKTEIVSMVLFQLTLPRKSLVCPARRARKFTIDSKDVAGSAIENKTIPGDRRNNLVRSSAAAVRHSEDQGRPTTEASGRAVASMPAGIDINTPSKNNLVFEPAALRSRQTGTGEARVPNGATAR